MSTYGICSKNTEIHSFPHVLLTPYESTLWNLYNDINIYNVLDIRTHTHIYVYTSNPQNREWNNILVHRDIISNWVENYYYSSNNNDNQLWFKIK